MKIIHTIADLKDALSAIPAVNFVPTMGHLHAGHVSLVRLAAQREGPIVVSIFVNPLQFAPHEDYAKYPRTLDSDVEQLAEGGCDVLFAPSPQEMYPQSHVWKVLPPSALADILEGSTRPGFFVGVSTVVLKLFRLIQPGVAVFGKKDYQQLLIVKDLVKQFALPIEILAGDTVREASGLAMSSRNGYLSAVERVEAAHLSSCLRSAAEHVRAGRCDWQRIEAEALHALKSRGWDPDYVAIRNQHDLGAPTAAAPLVVLGAARLGSVRLMDNEEV